MKRVGCTSNHIFLIVPNFAYERGKIEYPYLMLSSLIVLNAVCPSWASLVIVDWGKVVICSHRVSL